MKAIWDSEEPLVMHQIMDRANEENNKTWKAQTVSTFLTRLIDKGFVSREQKKRESHYYPLVTRQEYWKVTMEENARYFNHGDMGELACALCDDMLSKEDIERLKTKIAELSE